MERSGPGGYCRDRIDLSREMIDVVIEMMVKEESRIVSVSVQTVELIPSCTELEGGPSSGSK